MYSDEITKGIKEFGEIFNSEATKLVSSNINLEEDDWFISYGNALEKARSVFRTSDESYTDYEKFEIEVIPDFLNFLRNNIEDPRNPKVASIFTQTVTSTFQRKDTIKNLIDYIKYYVSKYETAKNEIESTIVKYENKKI